MRIGIFVLPAPGAGLFQIVRQFEQAEQQGFASAWLANIRGADALTVLALAGQRTGRMELGTFVVPTYPRHPAALAQQALTVQAAVANRLTLGIGLSHRVTMEEKLGFDWDHPIRHMREYLSSLIPLLSQQPVRFEGHEFTIRDYQLTIPGAEPPQVLVAALGPQMLRLTGRLAGGTALWMGGPRYIAKHVVPAITASARDAGRPEPRIVASLPVCVTGRVDEVREKAARAYSRYGQLPSYRAILDQENAAGPADVALIGSAADVRASLRSLADVGVTDFAAAIFAAEGKEADETVALLRELNPLT